MYWGTEDEHTDGGFTINERYTQTGQLSPRTQLRKRYLIQRVIGRGGMGAVYQAKDMKRRGTMCAIKEMSLSMVPPEERVQAIQNFKFEAKMLSLLSHPNLPAFTSFFSENQRYFLVMEYIDGYTLEDMLERQGAPFPEKRVLQWAEQLCDVLSYLHSQQPPIIFRDMKPGNIMLTRQGVIKLIDFGIARFFRSSSTHDTQLLGTPGYASPEQYGQAQTDERSDIYSLGMTLFHLLTYHLSEKGFGVKARDLRSYNPHVSLAVAKILEKATALDPEARFENVEAMRRALVRGKAFTFEMGETAADPGELAELCARYPEEAADYLMNGDIANWLHEIGEDDLADAAHHLSGRYRDPLEALEQFLLMVAGPNARPRGYSPSSSRGRADFVVEDIWDTPDPVDPFDGNDVQAALLDHQTKQRVTSARMTSRRFTSRRRSPVEVSPRTLDFGPVYPPGLSAPLPITIKGYQGLRIKGKLRVVEPWIKLDQTSFDGMNLSVNVRIQSTQLRSYSHYDGSIIISLDDESVPDITVTVRTDIQGYTTLDQGQRRRKTVVPDEDDEDDLEYTVAVSAGDKQVSKQVETQALQTRTTRKSLNGKKGLDGKSTSGVSRGGVSGLLEIADELGLSHELVRKYGLPDERDEWEAYTPSGKQRFWLRISQAFCCAFMLIALWYILLSRFTTSLLLPNPWFALVLAGMLPVSTLGALLLNREERWLSSATVSRFIAGMGGALVALAPINILWLTLVPHNPSWLHLTSMMLVTAIGATFTTIDRVYVALIKGTMWLLKQVRYNLWPVLIMASLCGGVLGSCLAVGSTLWVFTVFGILLGASIICALVLRVDQLLRQK